MSISIQSKAFPFESGNPKFYQPFPRRISVKENIEGINDFDLEEDPPLESDWHVAAMALLVNILRDFWTHQNDIYVSGNTVVRFDPNQKRLFRGPDLYVIKGVTDKGFRRSWVSWEENNKTPDFILELASKSTANFDVTGKKTIYEQQFKTPEYAVYNPDTEELNGWRLNKNYYQAIKPNQQGWLWCDEIGLWLGLATYSFFKDREPIKMPRFFDKAGQLLLTRDEAETKEKERQAQRAEEAEQRAERLAAQLQALGINPDEFIKK